MEHMLSKALRDFMFGPLNQLLVNLGGEDGARWEAELNKFNRKETCWPKDNPYLRKIAAGMLPATDGQQTMVGAKEMFPGCFDGDYANWGTNVPGKATPEMPFEVYELAKDGKFAQIFEGFARPLGELCWEQDKIIAFVEGHPELLHPQGYGTFFLFKVKFEENTENEREEFFVASVHRRGGQLRADVYQLSDGYVWDAEHRRRFVIPQMSLVA